MNHRVVTTSYNALHMALLVSFFCTGAWGQSPVSEELVREAPNDSVRFRIFSQLTEQHQYSHYKLAEQYSRQALQLAERNNWNWALATAYKQIGFLATLSGDYTRAIRYDNLALDLVSRLNDSTAISETLNFLGNDYSDLGLYDQAYYYFTQSYRVGRSINDSLRMAIAIHNLGGVFRSLDQHEIALNYFDLSKRISDEIGDQDGLAYSLMETGTVYLRKKDLVKAEIYFDDALHELRKRKLTVIEPRVLSYLGQLQAAQGHFDLALAYYDSAEWLHNRTDNEFGRAEIGLEKGKVYSLQKKYGEARRYIEASLATARQLNARKLQMDCSDALAQVEEASGHYADAVVHLKNHRVLRDSLYNSGIMTKLFREQVRYATELKDEKIAELSRLQAEREMELKRQATLLQRQETIRNILVVVVALTAILLYTIYRSGQRRKRINELLLQHQNDLKKRSVELEKLNAVKDRFFSIISHDLRSPINALAAILDLLAHRQISAEELTRVARDLQKQVNHARALITNLLDWALLQMDNLSIQTVPIDLRAVCEETRTLLSAIHSKEIAIHNQIEAGCIAQGDANMITLVFRNLISNAIKFTDNGGEIHIRCVPEGSLYRVSVADNGVGIPDDIQAHLFDKTASYSTRGTANEKGTGLGLILCKEFVERNGGKINFSSVPGQGSTFFFTIPKLQA